MVLFLCFVIGIVIFIRKLRKEPPKQLTREQRMTPYQRMLQEKKMQGKQTQQEDRRVEYDYGRRNDFPLEAELIHQDRHDGAYHCYSQPVRFFKPEAMYYMPK
jgi:hypothetical protein